MEPPATRLLRLAGSTARQQTLHTDIFIQVRPVDPLAAGDKTQVRSLHGRPMRQSREPHDGHGDRPAIRKFRHQSIVAQTYAPGQCFPEFKARSTHAISVREDRAHQANSVTRSPGGAGGFACPRVFQQVPRHHYALSRSSCVTPIRATEPACRSRIGRAPP
jgi:hypothetical protein